MTPYETKKEELKRTYSRLQKAHKDIHKLRTSKKPNSPKIGKQIHNLQKKIDRLLEHSKEVKADMIKINQANRKKNARPIAPMLPHQYAALAHCGDY